MKELEEAYTTDRDSPLAAEIANVAHAIALAATAFDEIAMALNRMADVFEQTYKDGQHAASQRDQ